MGRLTFEDLTPDDMPGDFDNLPSDSLGDDYRDELLDLRTATMPMRYVDTMIALRPRGAKVSHDEENARSIRDAVGCLDDLMLAKGLTALDDSQVAAMWCLDPADTFGMLDDFVARLGLDQDEVEHVAHVLFDMLPVESQEQLRELEAWGAM